MWCLVSVFTSSTESAEARPSRFAASLRIASARAMPSLFFFPTVRWGGARDEHDRRGRSVCCAKPTSECPPESAVEWPFLAGSGPMPKDVKHEAEHQTIVREKPHQSNSDSPVGILIGPERRCVRFPAVGGRP
jgi:hypothetical protein